MSDIFENRIDTVAEDFAVYLKDISNPTVGLTVFDQRSFLQFFTDRMLIVKAIRKGIPQSLFKSIKDALPFSEEDWADFLDISIKSLQRYKKDETHVFKSIHSEKILELTEVIAMGHEVFDTREQFSLWLNTPSYALGDMKPIELIKDSYGKELVINELTRIDQGIFA